MILHQRPLVTNMMPVMEIMVNSLYHILSGMGHMAITPDKVHHTRDHQETITTNKGLIQGKVVGLVHNTIGKEITPDRTIGPVHSQVNRDVQGNFQRGPIKELIHTLHTVSRLGKVQEITLFLAGPVG